MNEKELELTGVVEQQAAEIERLKGLLAAEGIKTAMAEAGVKAEKAAKAARLIDAADILDPASGEILPEALKAEIDALLAEFPEFLAEKVVPVKGKGGFKIGSDGRQKAAGNEKIASIFGNKR